MEYYLSSLFSTFPQRDTNTAVKKQNTAFYTAKSKSNICLIPPEILKK